MIYIGTYFTPELTEALLGRVLPKAGVAPLVADLPAGVEVSLRRAESRELLFVQNTNAETAVLTSPPTGQDLLSGGAVGTEPLRLEGYDCAIIRLGSIQTGPV
ncbi:Beta-galactosidase C-terminal domain [Inquilinus limosus]|uniref:Beta-galactosidase C-terminal domain n=1 Tax=Inquilinus limosus TaxID=171674 RepID=UPI0003FBF852|nr:Beta-galactosidase C-terminal domain [Inquilinus limosus]